jgi:hypothetical protein
MALVADDAQDRAAQLLALTEQLTTLLERETAAMRAHDMLPAPEETARLANVYRQEMLRIAEQNSLISGAPRPLLDRLRAATTRFREVLAAHGAALVAAREVTEGIVRTIAEEVARARETLQGYGASGGYAPPAGAGAALTTNKTA